jgi:hypothetical protein
VTEADSGPLDYKILVPVLTLRDTLGRIDAGANHAYAQKAAETWLDGFIINGTIGGGETNTPDERQQLLQIWLDHLAPARVYGCSWEPADQARIVDTPARLMALMRGLNDDTQAVRFLSGLPAGAYVYSHPRYTTRTYDPAIDALA